MARSTNDGNVHSTSGSASSHRQLARRCVGVAPPLLTGFQRQSLEHRRQRQSISIGRRQRVDQWLGNRSEMQSQLAEGIREPLATVHCSSTARTPAGAGAAGMRRLRRWPVRAGIRRGSTAPADRVRRGIRGRWCEQRVRGAACRTTATKSVGRPERRVRERGRTRSPSQQRQTMSIGDESGSAHTASRVSGAASMQASRRGRPSPRRRTRLARSSSCSWPDDLVHPLPTDHVQRQAEQCTDATGDRGEVDVASPLAGHCTPRREHQRNDGQHPRAEPSLRSVGGVRLVRMIARATRPQPRRESRQQARRDGRLQRAPAR